MFLSFCFPGLTQVCLDHSPWFMYKCIPFCSVHVYDTLVLCYQDSDLIVGVYSTHLRVGVPDSPFCHIMRMLIMCCHGEVTWQDLGVSGIPQILLIFAWHVCGYQYLIVGYCKHQDSSNSCSLNCFWNEIHVAMLAVQKPQWRADMYKVAADHVVLPLTKN